MTLLSELASVLEAAAVEDRNPTGSLYLGQLPDTPDIAMALRKTGGIQGFGVQETPGIKYERPQVQVLIRDPSNAAAEVKARSVWDAFNAVTNQTLEGTWYLRIIPLQSPLLLQRDENNRYLLVFDIEAMKVIS